MAGAVEVRGLAELNRAFKQLDDEVRLGLRGALVGVAEPVRSEAETLAVQNISHLGSAWSRMRIGVTTSSVYVAPAMRRRRGSPRPNLAPLLLRKAMEPALQDKEGEIVAGLELMLDRLIAANGF